MEREPVICETHFCLSRLFLEPSPTGDDAEEVLEKAVEDVSELATESEAESLSVEAVTTLTAATALIGKSASSLTTESRSRLVASVFEITQVRLARTCQCIR